MTSHGRVRDVSNPASVWFVGDEIGAEIWFDLTGATSIQFVASDGLPEGFSALSELVDEFISVMWDDGTRLSLVKEQTATHF